MQANIKILATTKIHASVTNALLLKREAKNDSAAKVNTSIVHIINKGLKSLHSCQKGCMVFHLQIKIL